MGLVLAVLLPILIAICSPVVTRSVLCEFGIVWAFSPLEGSRDPAAGMCIPELPCLVSLEFGAAWEGGMATPGGSWALAGAAGDGVGDGDGCGLGTGMLWPSCCAMTSGTTKTNHKSTSDGPVTDFIMNPR